MDDKLAILFPSGMPVEARRGDRGFQSIENLAFSVVLKTIEAIKQAETGSDPAPELSIAKNPDGP